MLAKLLDLVGDKHCVVFQPNGQMQGYKTNICFKNLDYLVLQRDHEDATTRLQKYRARKGLGQMAINTEGSETKRI